MENQNSTTKEKKQFFASLSKKKKVIICIAVLLLIAIGCRVAISGIRSSRNNISMETGNVILMLKDFESLGIVLAEGTSSGRGWHRTAFDALMREAAEKGADTIINVNISSTRNFFTRTWSGSATAIKYLDITTDEIKTLSDITSNRFFMHEGRGSRRNRF
ncbi:MAG: hypothetical protein FWC97_10095 [Treponema sp.]|nr:hypothetical protein [Treponema sp.]